MMVEPTALGFDQWKIGDLSLRKWGCWFKLADIIYHAPNGKMIPNSSNKLRIQKRSVDFMHFGTKCCQMFQKWWCRQNFAQQKMEF